MNPIINVATCLTNQDRDYSSCEPFIGSRFACITINAPTKTSAPALAEFNKVKKKSRVDGSSNLMKVAVRVVATTIELMIIIHDFFLDPHSDTVSKSIP